jgi:tRNA uridine 5-carbamoylmethylation protein Kti12
MKLIFLYGPPAAGKLTVAQALAQRTGYKLFHNHLTVDLAEAFFDFGTPAYGRYVTQLRYDGFEVAAREGLAGLIFTFVYALNIDDEFVRDVQAIIHTYGGQVCYVQLVCQREALLQRVEAESRQKFGKLKSVATLSDVLGNYDLFSPIPFVSNLSIDNTHVSAQNVAERIIQHYQLP